MDIALLYDILDTAVFEADMSDPNALRSYGIPTLRMGGKTLTVFYHRFEGPVDRPRLVYPPHLLASLLLDETSKTSLCAPKMEDFEIDLLDFDPKSPIGFSSTQTVEYQTISTHELKLNNALLNMLASPLSDPWPSPISADAEAYRRCIELLSNKNIIPFYFGLNLSLFSN